MTLVTGGAGYIGSHLVLELLRRGRKVIVVDNLSSGIREAIPASAIFYKADITNAKDLEKVFTDHKIDSVFHLAARTKIDESFEKPYDYYLTNTVGR